MNLKGVLIGIILVVIIILGVIKLMETLGSKPERSSSYMEETVNLPKKVKDLTEIRKQQIKEGEEQLGEE